VVVGSRVWGAGTEVSTTVTGGPRGKFLLADVTVARSKDFGVNDIRFTVRSHLGNILRAGDTVLGYDLESVSLPGMEEEEAEGSLGLRGEGGMPPVLIVRKVKKKKRRRGATGKPLTGSASSAGGESDAASVGPGLAAAVTAVHGVTADQSAAAGASDRSAHFEEQD